MSAEKATAAKRTAKKEVAVTRVPKSKRPATAAMTKSTASKKAVSKAPTASKTTTTRRTGKISAAAAKPTELKKITSVQKAPTSVSAKPKTLGKSTGGSAPAKVVSKAGPGRNAATTKPEGEVKQTPHAAKMLMEKPTEPSKEERQRWIATAAYHRAEKRGFAPGYEVQDWLDAEAEVNELIGQARSK